MVEIKKDTGNKKDVDDNKAIAALSYVFILCFIPLLMAKDSKFAQFHAKQGLVLFIIEVILMIASNILIFIPIFGWFALMAGYIVVTIAAIVGILKALEGELWSMPVVSDYAKKLKI